MSNFKVTDLTNYTNPDPAVDVIEIVNVSSNTNQKITRNNLLGLTSAPVSINDIQTLTQKTLTAPTISSPILSGTITGTYTLAGTPTFPSSVATLTGSQTLTNKVLTSPTINAPTITNASITADAITGFSVANTGTIYGIPITTATMSGANLANSTVTPSKLNLNPQTNYVVTDESTTSTTYTGLTTAQTVTVTIGANGLALVLFSSGIFTTATVKRVSVALSGANTVAANDNYSLRSDIATFNGLVGSHHLFTGLAAGSTTFTLQFKTASGTADFFERRLTVIPL